MKITINDIEFGYERAGEGEPVILVMGLGTPRIGWFPQFAVLSQSYDVTSFDNRGCGETQCPPPWTVQQMADDTVAIADAMGYDRFHLAGISMGGMISQEVALRHRGRLRSLTLISTTPGGAESEAMTPEFGAAMALPDPAERTRKTIELTFGKKFRTEHPEMIELVINATTSGDAGVSMLGGGQMDAGFMGQAMAVAAWMGEGGSASRLREIDVPTLVMHGGDDLLLPISNGKVLARDIPGARSRFWPEAGHALNAEKPDEVNTELALHFESASARV
jgi:3-oxoadipate enol-lactonase